MNQILALSGCADVPLELEGDNGRLEWRWVAAGIVCFKPKRVGHLGLCDERSPRLLISTGIHGNETAPIEIVAQLVGQLLNGERSLALDLLVVFGNLPAIEQGKRFVDMDLNRLFNGKHLDYPACYETARAAEIERHVSDFFTTHPPSSAEEIGTDYFHFDLHTAIRGSHHQRFGILPKRFPSKTHYYLDWLKAMGLDAIVLNTVSSGTFSSFTSRCFDAISCTLELGKARPFGANDHQSFSAISATLSAVVSGEHLDPFILSTPDIYLVEKELTKLSEDYRFIAVNDDVQNFTAYPEGTVLAVDGDVTYRVERQCEWIIFPNPAVRVGLRAGIMLRSAPLASLFDDN
jgi:succinylglutamate desuccinylase